MCLNACMNAAYVCVHVSKLRLEISSYENKKFDCPVQTRQSDSLRVVGEKACLARTGHYSISCTAIYTMNQDTLDNK